MEHEVKDNRENVGILVEAIKEERQMKFDAVNVPCVCLWKIRPVIGFYIWREIVFQQKHFVWKYFDRIGRL